MIGTDESDSVEIGIKRMKTETYMNIRSWTDLEESTNCSSVRK